jgi:hypothetical protein
MIIVKWYNGEDLCSIISDVNSDSMPWWVLKQMFSLAENCFV